MIRRTILFSGRVQGVGFRFAVKQAVGDATVTGYVRNLADGRVEAVFEGSPATIDSVVNRVRERMSSNVESEATTDGSATGEFSGFEIRR